MEKVRKKRTCRCGESKKKRAVDVEKVRKKKSCRCGERKKKEEL